MFLFSLLTQTALPSLSPPTLGDLPLNGRWMSALQCTHHCQRVMRPTWGAVVEELRNRVLALWLIFWGRSREAEAPLKPPNISIPNARGLNTWLSHFPPEKSIGIATSLGIKCAYLSNPSPGPCPSLGPPHLGLVTQVLSPSASLAHLCKS